LYIVLPLFYLRLSFWFLEGKITKLDRKAIKFSGIFSINYDLVVNEVPKRFIFNKWAYR
jgi:hypothetical protein